MEIAMHGGTIEDLMRRKKKTWIENKALELRGWRAAALYIATRTHDLRGNMP